MQRHFASSLHVSPAKLSTNDNRISSSQRDRHSILQPSDLPETVEEVLSDGEMTPSNCVRYGDLEQDKVALRSTQHDVAVMFGSVLE